MLTALALWTCGRIGFAEARRNVDDIVGFVFRGMVVG